MYLRYEDEFGRHKALDLIGDLALVGLPLLGFVEANKAGHALHTQLVSKLLSDPSAWEITMDERAAKAVSPAHPIAESVSAAD